MNGRLDIERIARERKLRAWSQQQLSEIAGLSLRTVQRAETTGHASPDTIKAIAGALDLRPEDIVLMELVGPQTPRWRVAMSAVAVSFAIIGAMVYFSVVEGQEPGVLLEYSYTRALGDELETADVSFLLSFDKTAAAEIADRSTIVFYVQDRTKTVEIDAALYEGGTEATARYLGSSTGSIEYGKTGTMTWVDDIGARHELIITAQRVDNIATL